MYAPYVSGFAWSDMVHGCMVFTELAPRRQQFHVAPAMPALSVHHFIKNPGHSVKSAGGRLQLNTYESYVCGFAWSDMVNGCMVYTELAPRRQQFHVAPAMPALSVHHFLVKKKKKKKSLM